MVSEDKFLYWFGPSDHVLEGLICQQRASIFEVFFKLCNEEDVRKRTHLIRSQVSPPRRLSLGVLTGRDANALNRRHSRCPPCALSPLQGHDLGLGLRDRERPRPEQRFSAVRL